MHQPHKKSRPRAGVFAALRNSFLAGLVVIAPIGLTAWLIWTVVGIIDGFVWPFVPDIYRPAELLNTIFGLEGTHRINVNVHGAGVAIFFVFTTLVGWIAKGIVGRSLLAWSEGVVLLVPVVRSIYAGVKQIAETIFSQSETTFDHACLVEYPRPGLWAIAFISTTAKGEVAQKLPGTEMVAIFLPTTPNPTSGFLLFVPQQDVVLLDMSMEDAAKLVISAGLIYPDAPTGAAQGVSKPAGDTAQPPQPASRG